MLVLSNEEIAGIISMPEVIRALEEAYRELGEGRAGNVPRADLLAEVKPGINYGLKTMSGIVQALGVGAVRINSDLIHWPQVAGNVRRVKIPAAPGGCWVGLVLLFSAQTGEPLAIMPDGVVQRLRVGGTSGLAAKYLARREARVLGLLGSGWQAGAQAMAMATVRPLELIKVYSPTPENRRRFAAEMSQALGVAVRAVTSAAEAAEADIVACATNALDVVFKEEWLKPGMHLTCVRAHELAPEVYRRSDPVIINFEEGEPRHYLVDVRRDIPELKEGWENSNLAGLDLDHRPELAALISGQAAGRQREEQITCFCNNIGIGIQFAAVGARLLQLAKARGVGRELPVEWFVQNVHP